MHTADAVLSGGSRRSACSVIFMKEDLDMSNSKIDFDVIKKGRFELNDKTNMHEGYVVINDSVYQGKEKIEVCLSEFEYNYLKKENKISWFHIHPQRARSNNSVLLLRDELTLEEFKKIIERTKQYGEPGFVFGNNLDTLFNPCFEISFLPILENGQSGIQFCNLTSQNGSKVKTKEDFYEYCKYESIIGTLQAGYTDFPFLNNASKKLTEDEALLGCSITGVMNNPEILLNPEILKTGAKICVETNKEWAKKIGINQAARVTCLKPEGTGSLIISENGDIPASGIHPHHAKKYFRRVQCNKVDPIYKFFKKNNPHMCEESVWSANKTDDVITFPIELNTPNIIVKDDLTAIQHLEYAKLVQKYWVLPGTTEVNKKDITHNCSLTVEVLDNEWVDVIQYIYDNKKYFTAISLLPKLGDKIYKQAPLERIYTESDNIKLNMFKEKYKSVDWNLLTEEEDNTIPQAEVICAGGACSI
jgi:ribonucleoside-triphosphate reductase